jgi:hypothetical protein
MLFIKARKEGDMITHNSLKMRKVLGILFGFIFFNSCIIIIPADIIAGAKDNEITGNRGYLAGGPPAEELKVEEKKSGIKRNRGKLEFLKTLETKTSELGEDLKDFDEKRRQIDQAIPEKKGNIAPKGYLVGTPKEKPLEAEEKGRGGFADGFARAMEDLKEFDQKIRKPYPADQSLEGTKGNYLYGEAPAKEPEPERELVRTRGRGLGPFEVINLVGKGIEEIHNKCSIRPHRSTDRDIWGFTFPDMPEKEKKGITKHKGKPGETLRSIIDGAESLINDIGADIEEHKANAPVDK